jgi:hypothetical protein
VIEFDKDTTVSTTTCPITIGILGLTDINDVRDLIITAINDAATDVVIAVTAVANGSGIVKIQANATGTAGNSNTIEWDPTNPAYTDISIDPATGVFEGGVNEVTLKDYTLTLADTTMPPAPVHTMTFKEDGTASSSTIINVQGATSVVDVGTAIGLTIATAQSAAAIAISVSAVDAVTGVVSLVADVAGTAMNGKAIEGDGEAAGVFSPTDFSLGAPATTVCVNGVFPASPGGAYSTACCRGTKPRNSLVRPRSFLQLL